MCIQHGVELHFLDKSKLILLTNEEENCSIFILTPFFCSLRAFQDLADPVWIHPQFPENRRVRQIVGICGIAKLCAYFPGSQILPLLESHLSIHLDNGIRSSVDRSDFGLDTEYQAEGPDFFSNRLFYACHNFPGGRGLDVALDP